MSMWTKWERAPFELSLPDIISNFFKRTKKLTIDNAYDLCYNLAKQSRFSEDEIKKEVKKQLIKRNKSNRKV